MKPRSDDWKCAGCGVASPGQKRACDCVTNVLTGSAGQTWKINETPADPMRLAAASAYFELQNHNIEHAKEILLRVISQPPNSVSPPSSSTKGEG